MTALNKIIAVFIFNTKNVKTRAISINSSIEKFDTEDEAINWINNSFEDLRGYDLDQDNINCILKDSYDIHIYIPGKYNGIDTNDGLLPYRYNYDYRKDSLESLDYTIIKYDLYGNSKRFSYPVEASSLHRRELSDYKSTPKYNIGDIIEFNNEKYIILWTPTFNILEWSMTYEVIPYKNSEFVNDISKEYKNIVYSSYLKVPGDYLEGGIYEEYISKTDTKPVKYVCIYSTSYLNKSVSLLSDNLGDILNYIFNIDKEDLEDDIEITISYRESANIEHMIKIYYENGKFKRKDILKINYLEVF